MHLADNGVPAHAAKLCRDLAGAQPFGPKLFQSLDTLVCPVHALSPPLALVMAESFTVAPDISETRNA
jgi:hypothetical protein